MERLNDPERGFTSKGALNFKFLSAVGPARSLKEQSARCLWMLFKTRLCSWMSLALGTTMSSVQWAAELVLNRKPLLLISSSPFLPYSFIFTGHYRGWWLVALPHLGEPIFEVLRLAWSNVPLQNSAGKQWRKASSSSSPSCPAVMSCQEREDGRGAPGPDEMIQQRFHFISNLTLNFNSLKDKKPRDIRYNEIKQSFSDSKFDHKWALRLLL